MPGTNLPFAFSSQSWMELTNQRLIAHRLWVCLCVWRCAGNKAEQASWCSIHIFCLLSLGTKGPIFKTVGLRLVFVVVGLSQSVCVPGDVRRGKGRFWGISTDLLHQNLWESGPGIWILPVPKMIFYTLKFEISKEKTPGLGNRGYES